MLSCMSRMSCHAYIILKPFDERRRSAAEINKELNAKFANIKEGFTYALMPPPIQGLGNGSDYSPYLEDRAGLGYGALQNALSTFQSAVAQTPGMTFPVSSYQANIPQLEVKVDRVKAKVQGIALSDLFDALQTYLGSVYINDFNVFGRVYLSPYLPFVAGQHLSAYWSAAEVDAARPGIDHDERLRKRLDDGQV
jgi:multidrug efflux pump